MTLPPAPRRPADITFKDSPGYIFTPCKEKNGRKEGRRHKWTNDKVQVEETLGAGEMAELSALKLKLQTAMEVLEIKPGSS